MTGPEGASVAQRVCPRFCPDTIRWGDVRAGAYVYCDHMGGWQPLPHPSDRPTGSADS